MAEKPSVTTALAVIAEKLSSIEARLAKIEQVLERQNGRLDALELRQARQDGAFALLRWAFAGGLAGLLSLISLVLKAIGVIP